MGDGVDDTPAHSGPSWDIKEGRATCWQNAIVDSCNATVESETPGIDVGFDPGTVIDASAFVVCRRLFTTPDTTLFLLIQ